MSLNQEILIWLNGFVSNNNIAESLIFFFTDTPIFFIPLFLVWYWIYYSLNKDNTKKIELLNIFYSIVISITIALTIQQFIQIDRPEDYLKWTKALIMKHLPDASFPSDHATVIFTFTFWLFFTNYKKLWFLFLIFAILMWLARISVWVHWPTDILWWIFLWLFSSFLTFKYLKNLNFINKLNDFILKLTSYIKL